MSGNKPSTCFIVKWEEYYEHYNIEKIFKNYESAKNYVEDKLFGKECEYKFCTNNGLEEHTYYYGNKTYRGGTVYDNWYTIEEYVLED